MINIRIYAPSGTDHLYMHKYTNLIYYNNNSNYKQIKLFYIYLPLRASNESINIPI